MSVSSIEVQLIAAQHTAVVRHRISMAEVQNISQWLGHTYEAVVQSGQQPSGMPFVRTLSMNAGTMEVEVGWPVETPFAGAGDVQPSELPGGAAAVATYYGPYEAIGAVYQVIEAWCAEHARTIAGPPWESYFTDPTQEPDSSKWRTDVVFPVAA